VYLGTIWKVSNKIHLKFLDRIKIRIKLVYIFLNVFRVVLHIKYSQLLLKKNIHNYLCFLKSTIFSKFVITTKNEFQLCEEPYENTLSVWSLGLSSYFDISPCTFFCLTLAFVLCKWSFYYIILPWNVHISIAIFLQSARINVKQKKCED
jgi:hypothetical protein